MQKISFRFFYFICVLFLCGSALGVSSELVHPVLLVAPTDTKVELLVDRSARVYPGKVFRLGLRICLPEGNHIYGKNPGEMGAPLQIAWSLPPGFSLVKEHWPTPRIHEEQGMVFFAYDDEVLVLADIQAPQLALLGTEESAISAHVEWVACNETCVPGSSDLHMPVSLYEDHFLLHPTSQFCSLMEESHEEVAAHLEGNEIIISAVGAACAQASQAWFISETTDNLFAFSEPAVLSHSPESWKLKIKNADLLPENHKLDGLVVFTDSLGQQIGVYKVNFASREAPKTTSRFSWAEFLSILSMAFLGGLILNIMPCVLPLITLKVYSLMQSSKEHKSKAIASSLWFTLGIVSCFLVLAGFAYLLKLFGHQIGWGFQLQEPLFVAVLIFIFFLFGLSSLGLFEVGTMFSSLGGKLSKQTTQKNSASGAFCNGVLATLVTTPCTGPFLGPVLGLGMAVPFVFQACIFACIGLGMASPYVIFALFPRLMSILPKPGSWMEIFKQVMGFMLLATAIWLVWIFGSETNAQAVVVLLLGLWVVSLGAWMLGRWGTPVSPKRQRVSVITAFVVLLIVALGLSVIASRQPSSQVEVRTRSEKNGWERFSMERLEQLRSEGKAVFVNFTATWCLTCQMNKQILHTQAVLEKFQEQNIALLEADWTKRDAEITAELSRLNRASVPVYAFYPADMAASPVLLPERLSSSVLEEIVFAPHDHY